MRMSSCNCRNGEKKWKKDLDQTKYQSPNSVFSLSVVTLPHNHESSVCKQVGTLLTAR